MMSASNVANFMILALLLVTVKAVPLVEDGDAVKLDVRDPDTTLTHREADWQLELFQGGDWGCNGEEMFIQTTYPEFPENECVNLGAQTDSGYFAYAGAGLCATVYADANCHVPLWQAINTGQCYWGLPGQYVWIQYNCPSVPTGPAAKRDMEVAVRDTNTDLIPFDKASLHPGVHLVTPEPSTSSAPSPTAPFPDAMPTVALSELVVARSNSAASEEEDGPGLASRDTQPFYLELFNDIGRSGLDPGCTGWPENSNGTFIPDNTCIVLDFAQHEQISSAQFAYADTPDRCAAIFANTECLNTPGMWMVYGVNQCHRGPTGWSFAVGPTCH